MSPIGLLQRWILFPSSLAVPHRHAGKGVRGLERLWRDTEAGRVEAWFLPADGASASNPVPAVIFAHGNAELIEFWPATLEPYRRLGMSVLLPEYRGYGRSAGKPSEATLADDFTWFYDQLAARPDVDPKRIVYHGRSLGGGAVCALAAKRPPAAMILQSTFSSIVEIARRYFVPKSLVVDPFDNVAVIKNLTAPLMIVHGTEDRLIPVSHAHALIAAQPKAQLILYNADHNDCPPDWDALFEEITAFLTRNQVL